MRAPARSQHRQARTARGARCGTRLRRLAVAHSGYASRTLSRRAAPADADPVARAGGPAAGRDRAHGRSQRMVVMGPAAALAARALPATAFAVHIPEPLAPACARPHLDQTAATLAASDRAPHAAFAHRVRSSAGHR